MSHDKNPTPKPAPTAHPAPADAGGNEAYLEWLQEDAQRHNAIAERARQLGYTCGGGIDAPPPLNPDGSLDLGEPAEGKPPAGPK